MVDRKRSVYEYFDNDIYIIFHVKLYKTFLIGMFATHRQLLTHICKLGISYEFSACSLCDAKFWLHFEIHLFDIKPILK